MSSSLNESKKKTTKTTKSIKFESKEAEDVLHKGVENIYQSFNIISKNYKEKISLLEKEINNLSEKLETKKKEIEMIQRENKYYKENNIKLKKEIEKLNKIVNNIKGKLTDGDDELNQCIKNDNINKNISLRKFYSKNNNKFKNNTNLYLYNAYKNNIYSDNNRKIEKNRLIHLYMNNKNNSLNYNITDDKRKEEYNNSSIDFQTNLNNHINHNKNNFIQNQKNFRYPISFQNKYKTAHVSREKKIKKNNYIGKKIDDLPRDSSDNKNRSHSSNKYIEEKENNKMQNDESEINNEDLDIKGINNMLLLNNDNDNENNNDITNGKRKHKKLEQKVCLTYDNLFINTNNNIKEFNKKKNNYNSFRGKIFNKNVKEKDLKNDMIKNNEKVNYFLNKCKNLLNKESVDIIINLFRDYNEGLITDKGLILQIQKYIWNNNELIELFNEIFGK